MAKANDKRHDNGQPDDEHVVWLCVFAMLVLFAMWLCTGCSPRVIEKVRTEHVYHETERVDTLVTKDSVYIREYVKGDTVYLTQYRDRYVYRYRDRTDTLAVHDTLTVEKETVRKVEKELTPLQKVRMGMGDALAVLLAALGVALAVKLIKRK